WFPPRRCFLGELPNNTNPGARLREQIRRLGYFALRPSSFSDIRRLSNAKPSPEGGTESSTPCPRAVSLRVLQFADGRRKARLFKQSCYIHAGPARCRITGFCLHILSTEQARR